MIVLFGLSLLAIGAVLCGCGQTERTITVTSDPPGAMVQANGVYKGRTPVTFEFIWYGDYDFELQLEGHETLRDNRHVRAAVHEWPVIDLFKEVFIPATFRDDKSFHFTLMPLPVVADGEMIERGDAMKDETLHRAD